MTVAAISNTMDSTAKGADNDSVNPNKPTLTLTIKPARMPVTSPDGRKSDQMTRPSQQADADD